MAAFKRRFPDCVDTEDEEEEEVVVEVPKRARSVERPVHDTGTEADVSAVSDDAPVKDGKFSILGSQM